MEVNTNESLGWNVRHARHSHQMTLRHFAKEVDLSAAHQSAIEQDHAVPSRDVIERIAKKLDLDSTSLCGLAGKITGEAERALSRVARNDPKFFRSMVERLGGAR